MVFLRDPRCAGLLVILSYVFPFAAIHSCICGYYFGQKETGVPAVSQLIEQSVRIGSVFLFILQPQNEALPQMSPLPLSDWQPESSLPPSTACTF